MYIKRNQIKMCIYNFSSKKKKSNHEIQNLKLSTLILNLLNSYNRRDSFELLSELYNTIADTNTNQADRNKMTVVNNGLNHSTGTKSKYVYKSIFSYCCRRNKISPITLHLLASAKYENFSIFIIIKDSERIPQFLHLYIYIADRTSLQRWIITSNIRHTIHQSNPPCRY